MKKSMTKVTSFILSLILIFSPSMPALATDYVYTTDSCISMPQDIKAAREAYEALSPEAKNIFDKSIAYDIELLEFHQTYVNPYYKATSPRIMSRAAVADPLQVLSYELSLLGLPTAVTYSLKAMGAGMVAAIADGPLPIGDILLAATTASAVAIIATNWSTVSPKFNRITKAFQKAFSSTASNVSSAFAKIKNDAKKEVEKNTKDNQTNKPTGNKVKDVQGRLRREGFKMVSNNGGSHQKWKKDDKVVIVPNHGGNKEIPIGTLRNIWRQAGWL